MPDLKSQSQALWLVVAAPASVVTVLFIPRIQSAAALSPERYYAVPRRSHKCCHFSHSAHSSFDSKWIAPQLFCQPVQKHAHFCLDVDVSAFCGHFSTQLLLRHSSLQQHPDEDLPSTFFQPFCPQVMRICRRDKQTLWAVSRRRPAVCVLPPEPVGGSE